MFFLNRLWKRVFAYALVLVLASGTTGLYLIHANLTDKAVEAILAFTTELKNALQGQSPEEATSFLSRLNNQEARFWIEDSQGTLVAGERFAGRIGKDWEPHMRTVQYAGDVALWRTDLQKPLFIAIVPCKILNRNAILYAAYMAFPVPPLEAMLSPSIITLLLITGMLALWIVLRVGRPLRQLHKEVVLVSGTPAQLNHVAVSGSDEIADVARAINRLVDNLNDHIDGMNQLVLNVSHELRSPLTRMVFSAEMIGKGLACHRHAGVCEADEETLRLAEVNFTALEQELEHMNKLIGDTLFASKLDLCNRDELTAAVDFSALCAASAERFMPLFRQAGIRFLYTIEPEIYVTGDDTLLGQVLSNLLDNSAKYASGAEPQARLRLRRHEETALLVMENTCSDTFAEDTLERLFDPYFRHEQRTGTGTGLGLPLAKKIAGLHKGIISAENGETGVLFRFSLPLRPPG